MIRRLLHFFILAFISLQMAVAQLPASLQQFIDDPSMHYAGIGVYVKDVQSGSVVANYRSRTNLIPASVTKLISTATALEMLGDTFKFETKVVLEGKLNADSTFIGDVYIIGGGDPTIESSHFKNQPSFFVNAAESIKKKGIKTIKGSVIGDASLYYQAGTIPLWLVEDIGTYYAPTPSAICAYDNIIKVYAGRATDSSAVELDHMTPSTSLFDLSFESKKCEYKINATDYSWTRTIQGPFTPGKNVEITAEMPEPALFVADSLENLLKVQGIEVQQPASTTRKTSYTRSDSCVVVYTHKSPTLAKIIQQTNYKSINLYAENLLLQIGAQKNEVSTHVNSTAAVASFWNSKGLYAKTIYQMDGSGLSMKNALNPEFLVNLLIYMKTKSKYATTFYNSLPVCGVSGTVKNFLAGTPLAGKAHFKSGSMERVQNYAGYIEHGGRTYAVCVMVNNFGCPRADLKKKMANMLNGLFVHYK
ncbi:MAG: D-alanyl-D-alanine carboxypeptidase/D-alanyl-D-alanine-endopeptidase [Paludibacteraceae bacterium]|nr:D-alanyl-D-alanine carboxypeptidase/D-alanyl-D-alanine-endopeptidase [Paludibacteraceae bacterium]